MMKQLTKAIPNQPPKTRKEVAYGGEINYELATFIRSEKGKVAQCKMFSALIAKASEKNWIVWYVGDASEIGDEIGLTVEESYNAIDALLYFGLIEFHRMWKAGGYKRKGWFAEHLKITTKGFERWNQK